MERRTFLRSLGLVALGSALPLRSRAAAWMGVHPKHAAACWLTPQETEGLFYFNPNLVRQDITEEKTGLPLRLDFSVIDENCTPIPNVLVDIWHCDKNGVYSGYNQPGGNTTGVSILASELDVKRSQSCMSSSRRPGGSLFWPTRPRSRPAPRS